ncbi:MAG: histidine--tRNA ligase [Candidatus Paceibacterota bacterium]|nr:MAG: histidine--tRNA ligase [Candidatus Paceibacterota bacterium]
MTKPKKAKSYQAPRGMHDILPEDQKYWRYLQKKAESLLEDYGFDRIDTPILEDVDVFLKGVGDATDIVSKELYTLSTKGGDRFALRPEGTASIARAYIEHGMHVRPHPLKLYYWGAMFRHDQPQRGRYRQFFQFGLETIGDASEAVDAELIFVGWRFLESIGLKGINVHINTIGDQNCRPAYIRALRDFYKARTKKICDSCKERVKENVLRVLDCKEQGCRAVMQEAPQIMDFLDAECKNHFRRVMEFLDAANVPYVLNPYLVRGLDYYTRTVFEFVPEDRADGAPALSVGGGGRYDRLMELLGGSKTPAAGLALGLDRIVAELKEREVSVPDAVPKPKVFLVQLGDAAKRKSLPLFEEIRRAGIRIKSSLGRDSVKAQLRIAHRLGVKYALIFGQKEALDGTVIVREMETGVQENIPLEKIVDELKKRLRE